MVKKVIKPWGFEEIWAKTDKYVGKKLHIFAGHKLSLQYHEKKEETIYVEKGKLVIEDDEGVIAILFPGDTYHIKPRVVHRFCSDEYEVILTEVSTTELDDVVRLKDEYGRLS